MPAGRPTDYKPEMVATVTTYSENFHLNDEVTPTVQGLAWILGVAVRTINRWCEEHEEFCRAVERMKAKQGLLLQAKGLRNEFNPTIAKLMLSANHDMREKGDLTSDGKPLGSADKAIAEVESALTK